MLAAGALAKSFGYSSETKCCAYCSTVGTVGFINDVPCVPLRSQEDFITLKCSPIPSVLCEPAKQLRHALNYANEKVRCLRC